MNFFKRLGKGIKELFNNLFKPRSTKPKSTKRGGRGITTSTSTSTGNGQEQKNFTTKKLSRKSKRKARQELRESKSKQEKRLAKEEKAAKKKAAAEAHKAEVEARKAKKKAERERVRKLKEEYKQKVKEIQAKENVGTRKTDFDYTTYEELEEKIKTSSDKLLHQFKNAIYEPNRVILLKEHNLEAVREYDVWFNEIAAEIYQGTIKNWDELGIKVYAKHKEINAYYFNGRDVLKE